MASHEQGGSGSSSWQVGIGPYAAASSASASSQEPYHHHKVPPNARHPNGTTWRHQSSEGPSSRVAAAAAKALPRARRLPARSSGRSRFSGIGCLVLLVLSVVSITIVGGDYLFSLVRNHHRGERGSFRSHDIFDNQEGSVLLSFWNRGRNGIGLVKEHTDQGGDLGDDIFNRHAQTKKALQFGDPFITKEELLNRDSRYWDRDDRRRDRYLDYENDDSDAEDDDVDSTGTGHNSDTGHLKGTKAQSGNAVEAESDLDLNSRSEFEKDQGDLKGGSLYNERGRKELRIYEQQFEAALKQELNSSAKKQLGGRGVTDDTTMGDNYDEYGGNSDEYENTEESALGLEEGEFDRKSENNPDELLDDSFHNSKVQNNSVATEGTDGFVDTKATEILRNAQENTNRKISQSVQKKNAPQPRLIRRNRRHRHAALPCEIDFLETTQGLVEPEPIGKFENFSLKYIETEDEETSAREPRFAGHQTLQQREQSFLATNQTIHCGFVHGSIGSKPTGFDLEKEDIQYLTTCKIAVSSCIFGSSDNIRSPRRGKMTRYYKKEVCFVMFVDQQSLDVIKQDGLDMDEHGYVGLWRIVVVRNIPYMDARRVGKIPKLLTHRLFPSARYSIWLDSKLRLQIDPVLVLEYLLWRGGHEYAISNHYDRHCVWEEVQQNKKLNKYNHTTIDEQFEFYQADGLTRFNASDPKKLLPSNVPEGSFIVRAHTPMSNLFSCLWFNEVDRFTSRDQLSFAYTYMKLVKSNPNKHFYLNMFKDCERKTITKLFRHRKNVSTVTQNMLHKVL